MPSLDPVTYERLPIYCYLCGHIGHIERKCRLHFQADFVDPGSNLPYGEWLQAPDYRQKKMMETRVNAARGEHMFGAGQVSRGGGISGSQNVKVEVSISKRLNPLAMVPVVEVRGESSDVGSVLGSQSGKRKQPVKVSGVKNRKKKANALGIEEGANPNKRQALGDLTNLFHVPVEAAQQPHQTP